MKALLYFILKTSTSSEIDSTCFSQVRLNVMDDLGDLDQRNLGSDLIADAPAMRNSMASSFGDSIFRKEY
jgi:hypothetical protein